MADSCFKKRSTPQEKQAINKTQKVGQQHVQSSVNANIPSDASTVASQPTTSSMKSPTTQVSSAWNGHVQGAHVKLQLLQLAELKNLVFYIESSNDVFYNPLQVNNIHDTDSVLKLLTSA